ncbi:hypothetical protein C0J52_07438 [Blattella germanica]|nr:hypothetical protein C0J52_07438 [Blattella germanica]
MKFMFLQYFVCQYLNHNKPITFAGNITLYMPMLIDYNSLLVLLKKKLQQLLLTFCRFNLNLRSFPVKRFFIALQLKLCYKLTAALLRNMLFPISFIHMSILYHVLY